MRLSVGEGKGAESVKITPIPKAGAHTMHAPLNMSMARHPNVADLLNQVVLPSILTQRSDELNIEADLMNADMHTHQSTFAFHHLLSSIPLP